MNHVKRALLSSHPLSFSPSPPFHASIFMDASFFHSTTVLERKRRIQWRYKFNHYAKRRRNSESKRTMLRNMSNYADYLFQSWREEEERRGSSRSSWFRDHHWARNGKGNGSCNPYGKGAFDWCLSDDDEGVETTFYSIFGRNQGFYWTYDNNSSSFNRGYRNGSYHNCSHESDEDEDEDDSDSDDNDNDYDYDDYYYNNDDTNKNNKNNSNAELVSARKALDLNPLGPLTLEEVKSAYRTCALRWHPDRHHGSSKVAAEEKFKHCSAAYETLSNSLTATTG